MRRILLFAILLMLIYSVEGYTSNISTFYNQDNPFQANLNNTHNYTAYLAIPLSGYIRNFTIAVDLNNVSYYGVSFFSANVTNGEFSYPASLPLGYKVVDGDYSHGGVGTTQNGFAVVSLNRSLSIFPYDANDSIFYWQLKINANHSNVTILPDCIYENSKIRLEIETVWRQPYSGCTNYWSTNYSCLTKDNKQLYLMNISGCESAGSDGLLIEEDVYQVYFGNLSINNIAYNFSEQINLTEFYNQILASYCSCDNCTMESGQCIMPLDISSQSIVSANITLSNLTYSFGLDNCSNSFGIPSNSTGANISYYDENSDPLSVLIEGYSDYGIVDDSLATYTQPEHTSQSDLYCIYPAWANILTSFHLQYTDPYTTYNYNSYQTNLTNATKTIKLYTQGNETYQCLVTVLDSASDPISDVDISILRHDIPTDSFISTETLNTDFSGHAIGNFRLSDTYYRMILSLAGETIYTDESSLMLPAVSGCAYVCCKTFYISGAAETWFNNQEIINGVETSLYYNNNTGNFVFNWNDPQLSLHQACLKASKFNNSGFTVLSDTCVESYSGTLYYPITEEPGARYQAQAYFRFDDIIPGPIIEKIFEFVTPQFEKSRLAVFLGLGLVLTLLVFGLFHPFMATLFLVAGVITAFLAHLVVISLAGVSSLVILWGVNEYVLHRKR